MEFGSQQSQHLQTTVPQNDYGGSYNSVVAGGNIKTFDQRRAIDVNAISYNPKMVSPNH